MAGRKSLPHDPPAWIDPACEIWFITICCKPRGTNQLTRPEVSAAVLDSVAYRWRLGHWHPHVFLLMPDHCHALISFPPERSMQKTVADWKHWTASQHGVVWQKDFFDHRLRRDESFAEKSDYIARNPARAGLVAEPRDWPHVWRAPGVFTGLNR